jgi:hypothetical protein
MNISNQTWHTEILPDSAEEVLSGLSTISLLSTFYLAGGTGLALNLGHRLSHDFDFFSVDLFNEETIIQKIQKLKDFTITAKDKHTLHIVMKGMKISFIGYNYPLLYKTKEFRSDKFAGTSFKIADVRDIACMKISAISSRGTKRDFIDLYMVAQNYQLTELLGFFNRKYIKTSYNKIHVLKSMIYFDDAELEPMPDMLVPLSWETVKQFFVAEVPKLL